MPTPCAGQVMNRHTTCPTPPKEKEREMHAYYRVISTSLSLSGRCWAASSSTSLLRDREACITIGGRGDSSFTFRSPTSTIDSSRERSGVPFWRACISFSVRWFTTWPSSFAFSLARFSLNLPYVVVLGITSERNSRLSIRETAVARDTG